MKLLNDLFRDLRDRRLLPVVAGLLIGIVAIPVLLASSPATTTEEASSPRDAAASAEAAAALALETQPVVAADTPGLRQTRRRLRSFRSKNPFKQQLTEPPAEVKELAEELGKAFEEATKQALGGGGGTPGGGGEAPGTGTPGGGGGEGGVKIFTHRLDIRFGEAGETKLRKNVSTLTLLPSDHLPVVSFLGVTESEKSAVFLVSAAAGSQGEGSCRPSAERCTFLTLRQGETQFLDVGAGTDDHVTYEMKLVKIRRVFKTTSSGSGSQEPTSTTPTSTTPETTTTPATTTTAESASARGWSELDF